MKRYIPIIALTLLSACAVAPHLIEPSEQWHIAPDDKSVIVYYEPERSHSYVTLEVYERYQIVGVEKKFYKIKIVTGEEYFLPTDGQTLIAYILRAFTPASKSWTR